MANELSEAERMAKFETKLENVVLIVTKMDAKMDAWQANFVSKELLEEKLKARNKEIDRLNNVFIRLENEKNSHKSTLPLWVGAFLRGLN